MSSLTTQAACGTGRSSSRVIAVSSSAHRVVDGLPWDDLQSFRESHPTLLYCRAKLANFLFTRELARRARPAGIAAQAMHPGAVASNFASHGDAAMQAHMAAAPTVAPDEPAETLAWLATDSEGFLARLGVDGPDRGGVPCWYSSVIFGTGGSTAAVSVDRRE